ncbi:hypothetical protein [Flavicella sediminum]|uniref:hypothetical protein n=1 Tax=Flavicella sediminum TaxID=2585141 RepID=UPI0011236B2D|nr:hypothetical protein [Flavicella sediminum]
MKKLLILFSFLSVLTSACNEQETLEIDSDNLLIGSWSHPQYTDNQVRYTRVANTVQNEYTCTFKNDGTLVENKNAGWCGTPPITYDEFTGKWNLENEETVNLESTYWGGSHTVKWEIISLTDDSLIVEINYPNL